MSFKIRHFISMLAVSFCACDVHAGALLDDIGYTALQTALGSATPNGAGITVGQVEASTVASTALGFPIYAPDPAQFPGKSLNFPGIPSNGYSAHATGVGQVLYGTGSMSSGASSIYSYEVNGWLNALNTGSGRASSLPARITNHSWVGGTDTPQDAYDLLRSVDRQVQRNEAIQVVAMDNGMSGSPLLGSAFNVIAVGKTDGSHDRGSSSAVYATNPADTAYVSGRTRPDVVVPVGFTSEAAPMVASATALLVQAGHQLGQADPNSGFSSTSFGLVYDAERSETIKAALMAGADRFTQNTSSLANILDYAGGGHGTANGLDDRYGAGQLNVSNAYGILAGGDTNSLEDGAGLLTEGSSGYDYSQAFGGTGGSSRTATYRVSASSDFKLTAALVWNADVSNNSNMSVTLRNLDLALFDATNTAQAPTLVASSASLVDNTENLWVNLIAGHDYELRVSTPEAGNFSWDYTLAWRMTPAAAPVPLPASVWLFAAGMGLLGRCRRRPVFTKAT